MQTIKKSLWRFMAAILAAGFAACLNGCSATGIAGWLFSEQYNSKGISHFLVITIDNNQPKEFVGTLEGRDVYIEKLSIDGTNFRSVDAENVSLTEAIGKELVSVDEWRKYAWKIKPEGDAEILQFENYEIEITEKECIIRPLLR